MHKTGAPQRKLVTVAALFGIAIVDDILIAAKDEGTHKGATALDDFKRVFAQDKTVLPCESCGAPVSFYGNDYPAHLFDGKRLCAHCYQKAMETAVFSCADCGGTFPKSSAKDDYCPACWKKHLATLRNRGKAFYGILEGVLSERGIMVLPVVEDCLDEYGMPLFKVSQDYVEGAIPLRKDTRGFYGGDERGIYAVNCKDALIAVPSSGIGLRFLIPSADSSFMRSLGEIRYDIAAIAGNTQALFLLHADGRISSLPEGIADFTLPDAAAKMRELFDCFSQEDRKRLERAVRESDFATECKPYDDTPAEFTDESARRFIEAVACNEDFTDKQITVSPNLIEISGEYSMAEWRALDDGFYCEHYFRKCITIESVTRCRAIDLAVENASQFLYQNRKQNAPRYPKVQSGSRRYYELDSRKAIAECPLGIEGIAIIAETIQELGGAL